MPLVDGVSHIATVTDDLDRMIGFYRRVFDAAVVGDVMEEEGLRHALIRLGPAVALHPFEVPGVRPDPRREMFDRGRVDHFGVTVPDMATLLEVRNRLRAEGEDQTDGEIRDFGALYSLHYVDPDGVHLEVNLFKDGWDEIDMLERADWTTIEPEPVA